MRCTGRRPRLSSVLHCEQHGRQALAPVSLDVRRPRMRITLLCLAVLSAVFVASCTIATEVELFNNTGEIVKLRIGNETTLLNPDESIRFYERELGDLAIETADKRRVYERQSLIPESFISWHGWAWWQSRRARVQIESDGKVWLVTAEQEMPAKVFVEQPKGFPLVPRAA
jgi:hypothetical protein